MPYVDGFLLPLPKKNLAAYRKMSRKAGKLWREHGALQYIESIEDDIPESLTRVSFARGVKLKPDEAVVFAFIVYKSKADRNRVNKKVMADPRLGSPEDVPFDSKRMIWGGFKSIVSL
ncbi:Uncharacterized conserved protein YbaA, DUF1428 family [Myxococcus fulvus]|uniref:RNA signal recognition particle n=1 Tax=Myxococcus fulvus TaxID=33 RepID=A0A511SUH5_MYXFU|nr:DUF1428 domain-containing protein [Myxococcus fulvus]AKF84843.1 hypothetical protein MFUL124B02_05365 [Myxococcus fulvus 124B02]GEN05575.1 RNA signal recognition particle [Myxococcus fulvus]SET02817.1 Uncharacterized conserved protein YbaA, DUF1428 family [Myxococcus fulvus]